MWLPTQSYLILVVLWGPLRNGRILEFCLYLETVHPTKAHLIPYERQIKGQSERHKTNYVLVLKLIHIIFNFYTRVNYR